MWLGLKGFFKAHFLMDLAGKAPLKEFEEALSRRLEK
jgi:hypothetical protein